jgi:hypothetical protein
MRILAPSIERRQSTSPDFMPKGGELREAVERHLSEEETAVAGLLGVRWAAGV